MKIAFLGDVALFGRNTTDDKGLKKRLEKVAEYLTGFDLVVANLESPFTISDKAIGGKSAYLKSSPADIAILEYLNISVVNVANNHIFDFGLEGYRSTLDLLDNADIQHFGSENNVVRIEKDNARVCFSGVCSFTTNPKGVVGQPGGVIDAYDLDSVIIRLKEYRDKGYFNILSVHSGLEHVNYPSLEDIDAARILAREGPFIYYGHHPHVIQGVEKPRGSLIAYSLGNFLFDDVYTSKSKVPLVSLSENNRLGMVLTAEIADAKIIGSDATLVYNDEHSLKILDKENDSDKYERLDEYSKKLEVNRGIYESERRALWEQHLNNRKSLRNISWFMRRLNIDTYKMLRSARTNAELQERYVTRVIARRT